MAKSAHKIGSLLFCPDCGTLLDFPTADAEFIPCEQCGFQEKASAYENIVITTRSHLDAFPSVLRQKRKTQTKIHESGETRMIVNEQCPNCGHDEAYSEEKQMRSADEGSTILYTCVSCRHGWRLNN
ncbi:DNA-directed RNA polymerase [Fomitiporia mediterranea MF3/22]|uniref:DNA-directed RNA polymerase n=1 Tax=Fomitiporia mediterranea (strain MF3/22) TaxID=694068 RepID=UPI0004408E95|nr:DNA-directed RNA polymerase [Fomitiporia mediterranea MF3/22]EJD04496.1 DNA-directed RNA polymerase [Fomitiporia mediterranea MF3/22]